MEGRSLAETPTWAVATVINLLVAIGFFIHRGLKKFGKWLDRTKRKHLLAALDKIKEELMVFGLLSLLMGHWIIFVPKICVKSSALSSRFYPCALHNHVEHQAFVNHAHVLRSNHWNSSISRLLLDDVQRDFCPKLCFSRQFWSSINQADYTALRLGFITTHQLPLTYDFHNYMLRSMEEEFRDIVGISVPLWIFAISCIILGFHGTNIYFWVSFLPAILILLVGTKLHHIVVKLAVEIMDSSQWTGFNQFNLRDELFWFGNPRLLLRLIQFVSFQNAFEMSIYIWSLWEIRGPSCFTGDHSFLIIRLIFGVVSQFWCSFITFPLCVIVTQMGSKYKKTIVSENVRRSLHGWRKKVRLKQESAFKLLTVTTSTTSLDSMMDAEESNCENVTRTMETCSTGFEGYEESDHTLSDDEISPCNQTLQELFMSTPLDQNFAERYEEQH